MTKKRFVAILLCVTLVALAAIGATFAYLTDSKTVKNTFTVGDVKIKLDETNVNAPDGDRVTSNAYHVYPGAVVKKDPIVHNVGENAAYIRATVNVSNWMNLCAAYYPDFGIHFPEAGYEKSLELLVGQLDLPSVVRITSCLDRLLHATAGEQRDRENGGQHELAHVGVPSVSLFNLESDLRGRRRTVTA